MLKYPLPPLIWSPRTDWTGKSHKKKLGTKINVSMLPFEKKWVIYLNFRIIFLVYIKNITPTLLKFRRGDGGDGGIFQKLGEIPCQKWTLKIGSLVNLKVFFLNNLVVWVVTAHRSFKFGPYVTSVASKAHIVITCFSRESPQPLGRDMYIIALIGHYVITC